MLSILIPAYNYNVYPLAAILHRQCIETNVIFEILIIDDASKSALNTQNEKINSLSHCTFRTLPKNIGRSAIRNLLAREAKFNRLLFLDADTLPLNDEFVYRYLQADYTGKVIYGGICYQEQKPDKKELLRWIYGNKREALPVLKRQQLPYLRLLTLNFLIDKDIFSKVCFNENIPNLRHEDTLFSYNLMQAGIPVKHIENRVYHLGLDDSRTFIKKSEEALLGLLYLLNNKLLSPEYVGMGSLYIKLTNTGLKPVTGMLFRFLRKQMLKNLLGSSPSMRIFDLYRIGYICSLKR